MARTEASGGTTVLLHEGEVRHMVFVVSEARSTSIQVRYSNDSDGPPDLVTLALDGAPIGQFEAEDTGDYGHGWNKFVWSSSMPAELTTGTHELTVTVTSGDYYGIEIDVVAEG